MFRFSDHKRAGEILGAMLDEYESRADVVVLALRRSAVEVGQAVAASLKCPFVFEDPPVVPLVLLQGATVILVNDGFATADELSDSIFQARIFRPAHLVAAAPIASEDAAQRAREAADESVFLATPSPFRSVGFWYEDAMREVSEALFTGSQRGRRRHERAFAS